MGWEGRGGCKDQKGREVKEGGRGGREGGGGGRDISPHHNPHPERPLACLYHGVASARARARTHTHTHRLYPCRSLPLRAGDRGHKGEISRMEFRRGLREDLGLHALEGKFIDGWFDSIDKDGGGTLDLAELKEALVGIKRGVEEEQREAGVKRSELLRCSRTIGALEGASKAMSEAMAPAIAAASELAAFRARPHLAARVGGRLLQRLREGHSEQTFVSEWDLHRRNGGMMWMEKAEFTELVAEVLGGDAGPSVGANRGSGMGKNPVGGGGGVSGGGGTGAGSAGGGSTSGGSGPGKRNSVREEPSVIRPSNPLGREQSRKTKTGNDVRRALSDKEIAEAVSAPRHRPQAPLPPPAFVQAALSRAHILDH